MTNEPIREEAAAADERRHALLREVEKERDPRQRAAEYERLIRAGELEPLDADGIIPWLKRRLAEERRKQEPR